MLVNTSAIQKGGKRTEVFFENPHPGSFRFCAAQRRRLGRARLRARQKAGPHGRAQSVRKATGCWKQQRNHSTRIRSRRLRQNKRGTAGVCRSLISHRCGDNKAEASRAAGDEPTTRRSARDRDSLLNRAAFLLTPIVQVLLNFCAGFFWAETPPKSSFVFNVVNFFF